MLWILVWAGLSYKTVEFKVKMWNKSRKGEGADEGKHFIKEKISDKTKWSKTKRILCVKAQKSKLISGQCGQIEMATKVKQVKKQTWVRAKQDRNIFNWLLIGQKVGFLKTFHGWEATTKKVLPLPDLLTAMGPEGAWVGQQWGLKQSLWWQMQSAGLLLWQETVL